MFENYTPSRLLLPVFLLSIAFAGFLLFQTTLLVTDRGALHVAYSEQSKTLEQVEKVKTQASALIKGVLTLSQKGNKNAKVIVGDLKKAGVNFEDEKNPLAPAGTAAPTAGNAAAP
ncbi:MAG: hypothetical protein WC464_06350, partial [Bdellovibrionales bacterium]